MSPIVRLAMAAFGGLLLVGAFRAGAAANAIPLSKASSTAYPRTIAQLTPAICSTLALTTIVTTGTGTGGNDLVLGTAGIDILDAKGGADCILGGGGNDNILGGIGNDVMDGGPGTDTCDGGAGTDTAYNCETILNVP